MGVGGLGALVKRTRRSITPLVNRANGVYFSFYPHGVGLAGIAATTLTADTAAIYTYGDVVEVLAVANNATEGWIEALVLSCPDATGQEYNVAVTMGAAITANNIAAEVSVFVQALNECRVIPLMQRVYIPPDNPIGLACGCSVVSGTINAWVVVSRNK